jgi:uncharacterized membrane protein
VQHFFGFDLTLFDQPPSLPASAGFINPHKPPMYLVAIAWIYVVLMMAIAEATASNGTILGAIVTFFLYGVLPTVILMYIMGTPMRRKALRAQEQAELAALRAQVAASGQPDAGSETPADAVTPVREKF